MNEVLILENLDSLDAAKRFVAILEIKYCENLEISKKIDLAKSSLDKALMRLAFDLQSKIDGSQDDEKKLNISNDIENALDQLQEVDDELLNQKLRDLVLFAQAYENNTYEPTSDCGNIRSRVLLIIAERFG